MNAAKFICVFAALGLVVSGQAQSPTPVQPEPVAPAAAAAASVSSETALRALQEVKSANEEMLRKQAATLQQLEEMEKAAEQIKIYSKRG
ncbi:MAG: hypothetical protein ABR589_05080 [Chthoniobacterales bacterium]